MGGGALVGYFGLGLALIWEGALIRVWARIREIRCYMGNGHSSIE